MTDSEVRVAIADDQALVRAGLRMILEAEHDLRVVAEAADGLQALEIATTTPIDVLLMDVRMPRMDGLEATRRLIARRSADPSTSPPVLILTTFEDDDVLWGRSKPALQGSSSRTRRPMTSSPRSERPPEAVHGSTHA